MTIKQRPDKIMKSCACLVLLLVLSGCATNPVTGGKDFVLMSEGEEITLGARYHQQISKEMPAYPDQKLAAYVNEVGQRIARASHRPHLEYHFTVVDSTQVNAFALPGGYIYVTRGLLAYLNSEAELAAVLGHEVAHVTARHSVRQHSAATATGVAGAILQATTGVSGSQDLFNVVGKAMLSGYGREHELESDRLGAQYLARTGYDPRAMLDVIGVLKNQELFENERAREQGREPRAYHGVFATHPDNDRRLQEVVNEANALKTAGTSHIGRPEFLRHLDGLTFGDGENDGVIRGNMFLHKPLDFGLRVPARWQIENQPDRLLVIAPQQAAFMQVQVEPRAKDDSPQQFLSDKTGGQLQDGQPLAAQGFQAYAGTAPVKTGDGARKARVAAIYDDKQAVVFTGASRKNSSFGTFDPDFLEIVRSYHKLTGQEKQWAEGLRLQLITAGANTRFSTLVKQSPLERDAEAQLRLLNNLYPQGEPAPGQLLKVVQ